MMLLLATDPNLFRFARPDWLWALAVVPALWLLWLWTRYSSRRRIARLGDADLVRQLAPEASVGRYYTKWVLQSLAIALLVVAAAGPQFGSRMEEVKRKGVEIMIALDVSNSMMAEDVSPNRLTNAKRAILALLGKLDGDRLGLVVFAGNAYMQVPLTLDYGALRMALETINTDMVPVQGTNLGAAIEMAMRSFSMDNELNKALILISDGENHDEKAVALAEEAKGSKVVIHTVGMGQLRGAPIPLYGSYGQKDYLKDRQGSVVISRLNEVVLRQIAQAAQGSYVRSGNSVAALDAIFESIEAMDEQEFEARMYADYEDRFQWLVALALLLLLVDVMLLPRKNRRLRGVQLFNRRLIE